MVGASVSAIADIQFLQNLTKPLPENRLSFMVLHFLEGSDSLWGNV
ncbi:MAG: hypothetical protein ACI875_001666 [Planctomycetota bacterium]|jgi:hypothetical protein